MDDTWSQPINQIHNDIASLLKLASTNFLPLDVRYSAAKAATQLVEEWMDQKYRVDT